MTGDRAVLEISAKQAGSVRVDLSPAAREIRNVFAEAEGKLAVLASRWDPEPFADFMAVIDPGTGAVFDAIRGRLLIPSPDRRLLAYYYRTARPTCLGYEWGAVLVYDITAAPTRRSGSGHKPLSADEPELRERGTIVYPQQHRIHGQYFFVPRPTISLDTDLR